MTTEDDFHAALDARPEDWQTRLVFADWLDERGDPRAEGYRALGGRRNYPVQDTLDHHRGHWVHGCWFYHTDDHDSIRTNFPATCLDCNELPADWVFEANRIRDSGSHNRVWCGYVKTRREAEDAAALAFANLPAERRAELLAGAPA